MAKKEWNVAVAGATGAVGNEMIRGLELRNFPVKNIKLLASERSVGKKLKFKGDEVPVEKLSFEAFKGVDIALFSAGGGPSLEFAPLAVQAGCVVVDNSSTWRMDPDVPLVVPEANAHAISGYTKKGIIANPNCSTIQMMVALAPIHRQYGLRRLVISTYQAVSGTGKKAVDELFDQTRAMINFLPVEKSVYPHRIAFNCLPQIDVFLENGYTKEEMKMVNESRKILEDPKIGITATAVRVPVFFAHSEAVNVETLKPFEISDIKALLAASPGVKIVDDPEKKVYPMAIDAAGCDETLVGRIRRDESTENGLNLWIVADNIRKGAATNAIQIAEILAEKYLS
ncbi:aspartate-semialdehyde dehydrogenase [Desulfococcaceae bacterium OttesenSCG-928-F15]|nr:aspartate-semialdehyde dehydrogenase [Desulfococcaceae bacterium OttesenSCG-928-F15]